MERQHRRQLELKPLTDAYFAWVKEHQDEIPPKSQTGKAFAYSINQEKYPRVFLDDLLPWSANLPERCRKSNKYEVK